MILFQEEKNILQENSRAYDVQKIGENQFAFKVNVNNIRVGSPTYGMVKMNDEDVPDTKMNLFSIRVKYTVFPQIVSSLE